MSPSYGISTYGKEYLLDEGLKDGLHPLRYIFIGLNIILGVGPMIYLTHKFLKLRSGLKNISRRRQAANALHILTFAFVSFMVNNVLRSSHMIDHICRPVYYHEPKWAYAKIWITEMEIPTYANAVMAIFILQGMGRLFRVVSQGDRSGLFAALTWMALYVLGSLFNLVHYTIEPPTNYGPFPNTNIAGTAVTNIPIIYILIKAWLNVPEGKGVRSSSRKRDPVNRLSY